MCGCWNYSLQGISGIEEISMHKKSVVDNLGLVVIVSDKSRFGGY